MIQGRSNRIRNEHLLVSNEGNEQACHPTLSHTRVGISVGLR